MRLSSPRALRCATSLTGRYASDYRFRLKAQLSYELVDLAATDELNGD